MKTRFYHFRQNNSGGDFVIDDNLDVNVIIEATDSNHANMIALSLGIYFEGCYTGIDCNCCGDRWNEVDETDSENCPHMYGNVIIDGKIEPYFSSDKGVVGKIHYLNGIVEYVSYCNLI